MMEQKLSHGVRPQYHQIRKVGPSIWAAVAAGILGLLAFGVMETQTAQAATLDVCPACTYTTIGGALAAAAAGDTISVSVGTYAEAVIINTSGITLTGAGAGGDPSLHTIIDGPVGSSSGIFVSNGITNVTIQNLRVQEFTNGGICAIGGNHGFRVLNTHVYSNTAGSSCLGGIYMNGPVNDVIISNNEAVNNTSRGIVIWNGFKTSITITHNLVRNNNCCGIELQDGTASGVLVAHNTVFNNADNGIGLVGLTSGAGPNLIHSNVLTNNGRFGIEVKLPNGTGLMSGDGSIVVMSNTVALTDTISNIKPGELRDLAGIAAFRRGWVAGYNNADIPAGVIIQGNVVSGYQQPSNSDGFGIVVEGARMSVLSNTLENNDVGVQVQAGHLPYTPFTNVDGNQNNLADQYFGRGNSPVACAITVADNTFTGNITNTRDVGPTNVGNTVVNLNTGQTFCGIQPAIQAPPTQNGHVIVLSPGVHTGTVVVTKSVAIVGAGPGQSIIQSLSPGIVVTASNVTISNTSIVGTGSDVGITTTFGVTGLTVANVHISNFDQGVALNGGHTHIVQNSLFTLTNVITSVGVGMGGLTSTLPVTNVLVSGNVFTNSGYAVVGLFVKDSQVRDNQMRYGIAGVRLAGAEQNVVENNQIENNSSYAIYLAPDAPPFVPTPVLSNSYNLISGNVVLNHPNDRGIQIINSSSSGIGNQIVNNQVQNTGGQGIFIGAGSGDTNLQISGNTVISSASAGIFVGSSAGVMVSNNVVTGTQTGLAVANSGQISVTGNSLLSNTTGLSLTIGAGNLVTATLNTLSGNSTGVNFESGDASGLLLTQNSIAGNSAGVNQAASGTLNAECNWYGAADGPSGAGTGSGDSVSADVNFNPWLLSDDLNGPCGAGLTIQKVVDGPITPVTSWQFTATVPTGTLAFTLPAAGGAITFTSLDFGTIFITETSKFGYSVVSTCSTGSTGAASVSATMVGDVTCVFTNTITPNTTVVTVTPVMTNGWAYITETLGPGVGVLPFDIVLPPPDPTLGAASARLTITDVNWRHMYVSPIFTGTPLSDITVFEYRLRVPSALPQTPYINIGWDDDVTDSNTGFRGRLVYSPGSLTADTWHTVDARNDTTARWYTTLPGAAQCTSTTPCTFAQLVAAYPNAAIHPGDLMGVPLGFVGIRAGGGGSTGAGYADGLRVGVGDQITLFDFEVASPTTITLTADPTVTQVGNSVSLTATVTISNGGPATDGTVVSFTTSLGNVSPVTATTSGGVAVATLSSTTAGVATVTATVGSLEATALVTFTAGAPYTFTFTLTPTLIYANGISQSVATVSVVDQYDNPVSGVTVNFLAGVGNFSPNSGATGANGQITATLTSLTPAIENVFAAVSGLGFASAQATYVNPPAADAPLSGSLQTITQTLGAVRKGDLITYTVTVTNTGAGQLNNVLIFAPIPGGTTYVAGSASGGNYSGSFAMLLSGEELGESVFGPQAVLNAVTWAGNLPGGTSHTLSYIVKANILEGQIVNNPKVFLDNADTGIDLSSTVDVVPYKVWLPIARNP